MNVGLLHVSEDDVRRLLPYPKAITLVRRAYEDLARGNAANPPRVIVRVPDGSSMFFMAGHVHGQKYVTMKAARVNPENKKASLPTVRSTVYVYDSETGEQVAEVEGESLTMIRTAASTAVATDFLARSDVKALGIFGSGREASAHIAALFEVSNFETINIYSRDEKSREEFAKRAREMLGISVKAASSPDEVALHSDVIVTATTSGTPVFDGTKVRMGSLVNSIGNAAVEGREVDTALVKRSALVVDLKSQALTTYGDIIKPIEEKAIRESDIMELGDLLVGKSKLPDQKDVTLFKSGGLAILDAAVTNYLLESVHT